MIIGLVGKAGCGKDTVARMLADYGFERRALADPLKKIASIIGWDGVKEDLPPCPSCGMLQGRQLLQYLGTEAVRKVLGEDTWIRALSRDMDTNWQHYVVTDVRFHNEVEAIRQTGGKIWRVERDARDVNPHVSEQLVVDADHVINNKGTLDELQVQLRFAIANLIRS